MRVCSGGSARRWNGIGWDGRPAAPPAVCTLKGAGIRNVRIMEAAREGPMQMALAERGAW